MKYRLEIMKLTLQFIYCPTRQLLSFTQKAAIFLLVTFLYSDLIEFVRFIGFCFARLVCGDSEQLDDVCLR